MNEYVMYAVIFFDLCAGIFIFNRITNARYCHLTKDGFNYDTVKYYDKGLFGNVVIDYYTSEEIAERKENEKTARLLWKLNANIGPKLMKDLMMLLSKHESPYPQTLVDNWYKALPQTDQFNVTKATGYAPEEE